MKFSSLFSALLILMLCIGTVNKTTVEEAPEIITEQMIEIQMEAQSITPIEISSSTAVIDVGKDLVVPFLTTDFEDSRQLLDAKYKHYRTLSNYDDLIQKTSKGYRSLNFSPPKIV